MATYRSIVGQKIKKVSSDPSNPIEGQIWYNTTTGTLKGAQFNAAAWASGGNLPLAKRTQGCGTQTAGLTCMGYTPSPGYQVGTEEYDGTSWTESNNANNARNLVAVY